MGQPDEILFKELVERYQNKVFNTAISFVQNTEDAEDVSQEVFIEVHRSLSGFNQQSTLSTWIYRITVNKSVDHLRKRNRQKRFGFLTTISGKNGELKSDKSHFDHPGVQLENKEKSRILFGAIDELPENQKTAFILFHIEELSQKEVALIMNNSAKAVESLIQRARAALRLKLGKIYNERGI